MKRESSYYFLFGQVLQNFKNSLLLMFETMIVLIATNSGTPNSESTTALGIVYSSLLEVHHTQKRLGNSSRAVLILSSMTSDLSLSFTESQQKVGLQSLVYNV